MKTKYHSIYRVEIEGEFFVEALSETHAMFVAIELAIESELYDNESLMYANGMPNDRYLKVRVATDEEVESYDNMYGLR